MDKIFSAKPWVQPLLVAGTSCDSDSENSSSKETYIQSSKKHAIILYILQFVINVFVIFHLIFINVFPFFSKKA